MKTFLLITLFSLVVGGSIYTGTRSRAGSLEWSKVKYFDVKEFDCPGIPLSGYEMDKDFIFKLDAAREIAQVPFQISSGYRTPSYNRSVGGVAESPHILGYAADIKVTSSQDRLKIIDALLKSGFVRIGIYKSHIHVDNDPDKPQDLIFHGEY